MKHSIWLSILLTLLCITRVSGQDREHGLAAYDDERYEEALESLLPLQEDSEAQLVSAKSALALGQYDLSARLLQDLQRRSIPSPLFQEADYTFALVRLRQKRPYLALERLYKLKVEGAGALREEAEDRYEEIRDFMTLDQIRDAFREWDNQQGRLDLILPAARIGGASVGRSMLDILRAASDDPSLQEQIARVERSLERIPERQTLDSSGVTIPEGMVFHMGVALPLSEERPEDAVSRQLYSGLLMAAEEQNRSSNDVKVQLHFRGTDSTPESAVEAMNKLIWEDYSDLVIGPLFTEPAMAASRLAEQYQVPVITPLANTGQINDGHHYTFQLNADFSRHGEEMARKAVLELRMDTLAVFTQEEGLGRESAIAFRNEAERLGAHVAWFVDEPYRQLGYDLSSIFDRMFPHTAERDSDSEQERLFREPQPEIDGVYAPFTGQEAETLASMLLTELEGRNLRPTVLGSQTWSSLRYTASQQSGMTIYYSRGYRESGDGDDVARFEDEFRNQFGFAPDEFAQLGYDTGTYLIEVLLESGNPSRLHHMLRSSSPYSGLVLDVEFGGAQMNRRVQILPATDRARSMQ